MRARAWALLTAAAVPQLWFVSPAKAVPAHVSTSMRPNRANSFLDIVSPRELVVNEIAAEAQRGPRDVPLFFREASPGEVSETSNLVANNHNVASRVEAQQPHKSCSQYVAGEYGRQVTRKLTAHQ